MKEIIIKVPESKFEFVIELIKNLGIKFALKKEEKEDIKIHQWQIKEATKRLKALEKNPEKAIDFDKTIDKIEAKYGL